MQVISSAHRTQLPHQRSCTICTQKLEDRAEASRVVDAKCQTPIVYRIGVSTTRVFRLFQELNARNHGLEGHFDNTSLLCPAFTNLGAITGARPGILVQLMHSDPIRNDRSGTQNQAARAHGFPSTSITCFIPQVWSLFIVVCFLQKCVQQLFAGSVRL